MRGLAMASVAFMLSACALGPDYVRPDITTPGGFRMARAEGESIANLPWWQLLRDDKLQKLVRISLQENKDLHQALASIEEFQARLAIARMDFAPQVSGTANAPAFGRMNATSLPRSPTPRATTSRAICPGRSTSGGGCAARTKRRVRTSSRGRRIGGRWS